MNYDYNKLIGTDLDANIARTKKIRNFAIAGIPTGFICFGLGGALTGLVALPCLVIALAGFFLIPTSVITMATQANKLMYMRQIKTTADVVKSQDKAFLYQICGGNPATELQMVMTLNKLIEIGYLEGYEVIENLAIAKTSLGLSANEVRQEYMMLRFGKTAADFNDDGAFAAPGSLTDYAAKTYDKATSATKECYFCHTVVPADATYCTKCGARLDN